MNGDRLLTVEETAEYLAVPVSTLRYWVYTRTGPPSIKVGRLVRYRSVDLEAWLDAQTTRPVRSPRGIRTVR